MSSAAPLRPRPESVSQRLFLLAHQGNEADLVGELDSLSEADASAALSAIVCDGEGQMMTTVIAAAKEGHHKVVQVLVDKYKSDLAQRGTVKLDMHLIQGASALWCASGAGQLKVASILVEAGADVNQTTSANSTPLRAASFNGHTDLVKLLVAAGADINIANNYDNSCLMIAGFRGHADVVRFLLEKGADPDVSAKCGATALHFAASDGHLGVVRALGDANANLTRNVNGMTPLFTAAERCQADIVEFIAKNWRHQITKSERIEALELLGASLANDKDKYDSVNAFKYLMLAMKERWCDPENQFPKHLMPPIEAYGNWKESDTVERLASIENIPDSLHMEGLTIRERLLGHDHPDLNHPIIFRGAVFADVALFNRSVQLWLHALRLKQRNKSSMPRDLLRFAQVFSQILHVGQTIAFSDLAEVLHASKSAIQQVMAKLEGDDTEAAPAGDTASGVEDDVFLLEADLKEHMNTFIYLLVIFTKVRKGGTGDERFEAMKSIYQVVRMNPRYRDGRTLLHLCVDSSTDVDTFHTADIVRFPSAAATRLLVEAGADVETMDNSRNTPLHYIVKYKRVVHDFSTLHSIISLLIASGAHTDVVNLDGHTPFKAATTTVAEIILKTQQKMSLKCMAAQSIKRHGLTYQGHVPKQLEKFIELHGL